MQQFIDVKHLNNNSSIYREDASSAHHNESNATEAISTYS